MKRYHIYLILIISFFFTAVLKGQDIHFSQIGVSPLNNGMIMPGSMNEDVRLSGILRRQWSSVPVNYRTFQVDADARLNFFNENIKTWNAGIFLFQDIAGDGNLSTLQASLSIAKEYLLEKDSSSSFLIGINGGFINKSINTNNLTFGNQFNGDQFNPLSPSGESFSRTSVVKPDIGFSLAYIVRKPQLWSVYVKAGHLNKPDISFYNSTASNLPVLLQAGINTTLKSGEGLYIIPGISVQSQRKNLEIIGGAELKFIFNDSEIKKSAFGVALYYRNRDAIVPCINIYRNKTRFGFSYDINVSDFRTATAYRGGPEFSIVYLTSRVRPGIISKKVCPVY